MQTKGVRTRMASWRNRRMRATTTEEEDEEAEEEQALMGGDGYSDMEHFD